MVLPGASDEIGHRLGYKLAVQRSRLVAYALAGALAALAKASGVLQFEYGPALGLIVMAMASAALCHELYRWGVDERLGLSLRPFWISADIGFITWGIYLTGGLTSPWFVWYLSNTAAAAFVAGPRGAVAVAVTNSAAYLLLLHAMGQIGGRDAGLALAASRMLFLYGSAFFFLRGVASLQHKNLLVRRLQRDQAQRVERLEALTQDLDQGTQALAEANTQIREADRMKSQFLANMSHELRTPLNSIIGFSEILLERLRGQGSEKHLRFLGNILASGQHLLGIINDILDLSKIEAGKMELHPEPCRVLSVVEGVLSVMQGQANLAGVGFVVDVPETLPVIETDPVRFKQILYNLASNAVKFSPQGAKIEVSARHLGAPESPLRVESLALEVADHGIGIAPDDQALIFEEFRQVESSGRWSVGGTGLGLALVRKFAVLQGGQVSVESALGQGSRFRVLLPLARRARPTTLELMLKRGVAEHCVLVVEDDLASYQCLARTLSEAGYDPVRARHGDEALELARALRPAVITLDLGLPGPSGWDVLKALKRERETRAIPVVIVSMLNADELGLALGADDYFVKPVDRARLLTRLGQIAPVAQAATAPRLLLIDGDPGLHELMDDELGALGYAVAHARSGHEGIESAVRERPDLIVLDLLMPDLTGFEVAAALKQREETAHVPIVVLTAKELSEPERRELQGKIAALVPKGQAPAGRLLAAIHELEGRRPRQAADVG